MRQQCNIQVSVRAVRRGWTARILGLGLMIGLMPSAALACACCASHGDRYVTTEAIEDYDQGVIDGIKFARSANLYSTEADWEEQVKGINNPAQSYLYDVKLTKSGRKWGLAFKDDQGNSGELTLNISSTFTKMAVDQQPQLPAGGDYVPVELYKEWRLNGPVLGNGMFKLGALGLARAQLTFHGRGNGCTSTEQFTNWTLDVTGGQVQFRMFGKLKSAYAQ